MSFMSQEPLTVQLSSSLKEKLTRTAQDEGVSVEALVQELLAEGVVLRAWEIIERKSTMRGNSQPQQQGGGQGRSFNNSQQPRNGNHNNGPRRNQPNGNWMEDRAAFLEYVRNQEKGGRR